MTDDQIKRIYLESTGFDLDESDAALMDFARATRDVQPPVPQEGDELAEELQEAREILENMVRSIELDGNYSTEATCTFLRQALLCLPVALASSNAAAVASPGEEYQVKSDPIMCWETYQDRAVAQKHFDQLKADGCNAQFRVIYTAPIASAEQAVPTAADILANQMQFGADMAAKYSRVCRELAALKAVAPDEDSVKRALATYNSEYCLQRAAGVGGGEAELIAMTKVLSTHPAAAQPSRAEVPDAAIKSCALIIKGMCMTHPVYEWAELIEARIRFMLKDKP